MDKRTPDTVNMTIYTTDQIRNRIKAAGALQGKSMSVFVVETVLKEIDRLEGGWEERFTPGGVLVSGPQEMQ